MAVLLGGPAHRRSRPSGDRDRGGVFGPEAHDRPATRTPVAETRAGSGLSELLHLRPELKGVALGELLDEQVRWGL